VERPESYPAVRACHASGEPRFARQWDRSDRERASLPIRSVPRGRPCGPAASVDRTPIANVHVDSQRSYCVLSAPVVGNRRGLAVAAFVHRSEHAHSSGTRSNRVRNPWLRASSAPETRTRLLRVRVLAVLRARIEDQQAPIPQSSAPHDPLRRNRRAQRLHRGLHDRGLRHWGVEGTRTPGPVHLRQMDTYLKISGYPLGLILNFGAPRFLDGVARRVNNFPHGTAPYRKA
jgi:hypothetical protein